jgi:hypothetical protein
VDLPWAEPLGSWSSADASVVDVPLGAGRHLVRVVRAGGRLWALEELPRWVAEREHAALVVLEHRGVPAVRAAGLVTHEADGSAVPITEYLRDAVLWRSLLADLSASREHRARPYDAVAVFMVDLHRSGVFWGDCSLSNLLFRRDGPAPSRPGDRGGRPRGRAARPACREGRPGRPRRAWRGGAQHPAAVRGVVADRARSADAAVRGGMDAVSEVARLDDLGCSIDEVRLASEGSGVGEVRLHTVVAHRRHHADELQRLTGLRVGEGQAAVLLGDLRSHGRAAPSLARARGRRLLARAVVTSAPRLPCRSWSRDASQRSLRRSSTTSASRRCGGTLLRPRSTVALPDGALDRHLLTSASSPEPGERRRRQAFSMVDDLDLDLDLDGGGSTAMVVRGTLVSRPRRPRASA